MRVKRFNNLWSMGLLLFSTLLIGFYIAKIFFPEFVLEIAETPEIVKFGEYVDTHKWAYYLFTFTISYSVTYFYCCACCRKRKLTLLDSVIVIAEICLLFLVQAYLPKYYLEVNVVCMLVLPTVLCYIQDRNQKASNRCLYSTITCFTIHTIAQLLSLSIRGLAIRVSFPNSATLNILLIDLLIWVVLLYNYYNYKGGNDNGNT